MHDSASLHNPEPPCKLVSFNELGTPLRDLTRRQCFSGVACIRWEWKMGKQVRLDAMVHGRHFSEQPRIRPVSAMLMLVLLGCAGNASQARDAALQGRSAPFAVLDEAWLSPNNCDAIRDPIRIEALDERTFIFRESPCVDREAPFLFSSDRNRAGPLGGQWHAGRCLSCRSCG